MNDALSILQKTFGYNEFRGQQADIIAHVLAGNDALVLMPTGGGKSLCFQIPAILRKGTAVVISPLIALMQDQVATLSQLNVRAVFLNSSLTSYEVMEVEEQLREGKLDLIYVAPERLLMPSFLEMLDKIPLALFAIDEAHCVSQWGHDFRPEYMQLSMLHERYPSVPRIALTATADHATRKDIIEKLKLEKARKFITSFDRPNIRYRIVQKNKVRNQLQAFLEQEHKGDAGIVYCLSRKRVEDVATWLQEKGFPALPYHAGLPAGVRQKHQQRFLQEEGCIMVATVAFGMGIDKSNVRFVAHLDLPKSMEGYYQETGRAGRDGLSADAWLSYGLSDVILLREMLGKSLAEEKHKRLERRKLDALLGYCETTLCRRMVLLHYFGEAYQGPCNNCDNCLEPVATWDGKVAAQKALSCVYRTGQRFGVKHLIDVLMGKETEQVLRFRHDKVSTYGIGKEYTQMQWQSIFRQLVAANFLTVDLTGFGTLRLTESAGGVLKGQTTLALRKDMEVVKTKVKGEVGKKIKLQNKIIPQDELWQALKSKRMELAQNQGVPPYIIFHDSSLIEMHSRRPRNRDEFAEISGVGESKLEKYGEHFLRVIAGFCDL